MSDSSHYKNMARVMRALGGEGMPFFGEYLDLILAGTHKRGFVNDRDMLLLKGTDEDMGKALWNIVTAKVASDRTMSAFWNLMAALYDSGLGSLASEMLPTHYVEDEEPRLIHPDSRDERVQHILQRKSQNWVTGDPLSKQLAIDVADSPDVCNR